MYKKYNKEQINEMINEYKETNNERIFEEIYKSFENVRIKFIQKFNKYNYVDVECEYEKYFLDAIRLYKEDIGSFAGYFKTFLNYKACELYSQQKKMSHLFIDETYIFNKKNKKDNEHDRNSSLENEIFIENNSIDEISDLESLLDLIKSHAEWFLKSKRNKEVHIAIIKAIMNESFNITKLAKELGYSYMYINKCASLYRRSLKEYLIERGIDI